MAENRINILTYLHQAAKYKWKIILNFFVVCILAVGVSLMVPKTYVSSSTVLPESSDMGNMGLSSLLSDIPNMGGLGSLMSGLGSEGTTLVALLNSRSLKDSLINKFDLQTVYKTKTMVETRKAVAKHIGFEVSEEGTIRIYSLSKTKYFSFGDKDNNAKQMCYNMTTYMLKCLDNMNQKLRAESARNNRAFIEKRYLQNLHDLKTIEEQFKRFQQETGIISLDEQTKAAIEVMAQVKGLMVAKEVEIEQLKQLMAPSHQSVLNAERELKGLQIKYNDLITGNSKNSAFDIFPAMKNLPDYGLEYLRLYRELMIQEKIQEFIVPMFEQAKIQEAKDTPSLQVVDQPVIPDKKAKPKRAFIVLFAGFAAIFFSLASIYFKVNLDYLRENDTQTYNKLQSLGKELRFFK